MPIHFPLSITIYDINNLTYNNFCYIILSIFDFYEAFVPADAVTAARRDLNAPAEARGLTHISESKEKKNAENAKKTSVRSVPYGRFVPTVLPDHGKRFERARIGDIAFVFRQVAVHDGNRRKFEPLALVNGHDVDFAL